VTAVEPSLESLDGLAGVDALCMLLSDDDRPLSGAAGYLDWRLCGGLSRVLLQGFFKADKGEQLLMPTLGRVPSPRLFAVGVGPSRAIDAAALKALLASSAQMLKKAGVASVALSLPRCGVDEAARAEAVKRTFLPAFSPGEVTVFAEKALRALL
jgi:hypothetical protein